MTTNRDFDRTNINRETGGGSTSGRVDPTSAGERAAAQAGELKDRAAAQAGELKDHAAAQADELKGRAAEAGQQAAERIDSAMSATGEGMRNLAQTLRQNTPGGQTGEVAQTAARALERSGAYLERADPQMVRSDLEQIIRDHPIETLVIGLGIGFLLGKSRSSRRGYYG
ncbi:MAG: hypothetical protein HGA45_42840 [Chloroflexales bacterium]|nr:hypothetical protein [Chloroflexales bacterium]